MPTENTKDHGEVRQAPKILDLPIGTGATGLRKESDSLGAIEVPADCDGSVQDRARGYTS
jgi:fumarate hydratase, class II